MARPYRPEGLYFGLTCYDRLGIPAKGLVERTVDKAVIELETVGYSEERTTGMRPAAVSVSTAPLTVRTKAIFSRVCYSIEEQSRQAERLLENGSVNSFLDVPTFRAGPTLLRSDRPACCAMLLESRRYSHYLE